MTHWNLYIAIHLNRLRSASATKIEADCQQVRHFRHTGLYDIKLISRSKGLATKLST